MELENIKNRGGTAYALFEQYKHKTGTFIRSIQVLSFGKAQTKFFDKIMKPLSLSLTIMINMDLTQTRSIGGFQLS